MSAQGEPRKNAGRRVSAWLRAGNWRLLVLAAALVAAGSFVYAEVSGKLELRAPSPQVAWSPPATATPEAVPIAVVRKTAAPRAVRHAHAHKTPRPQRSTSQLRRIAFVPKPRAPRHRSVHSAPRTVVDAIVYRKPSAFSPATAQPSAPAMQTSAAEFARGLVQSSDPQAAIQSASIVSDADNRIVVEVLSFEDGVALTDQFTLRAQKGEYTVEKYERLPGDAQSAPSQVCYRRGQWYPCTR